VGNLLRLPFRALASPAASGLYRNIRDLICLENHMLCRSLSCNQQAGAGTACSVELANSSVHDTAVCCAVLSVGAAAPVRRPACDRLDLDGAALHLPVRGTEHACASPHPQYRARWDLSPDAVRHCNQAPSEPDSSRATALWTRRALL